MRRLLLPALLLGLSACRGTYAERYGDSKFGFAGVIIRGRIITPAGEMPDGRLALNLRGDVEEYRLRFVPGETTLFRVEPDVYRLHPTRNLLGFVQRRLKVEIAGRTFSVPFPREILRKEAIEARPTHLVPLGVLEARLLPPEKGKRPRVEVTFDDSLQTRRQLVEDVIDKMIDPKVSVETRFAATSWARALENALLAIQSEEQGGSAYKKAR